ncbi:MAG: PD-(D/E)XK nuclease family transposase [Lachnospiraceae bacterium]|nr:PD-(D/E)XK nuclease family transposase [Lachnospiraceae bacterium]
MVNKSTIETYEDQQRRIAVFNLTSDLFAGKVFEDTDACQELCRILLQNECIALKSVKTQYTIRNLENHSVELDILAEEISGNLINVELQMYKEPAPFKRTRYYLSSIDMSILEKGKPYYELPNVTVIYITHEDFIGGKRGQYIINRKTDGQKVTTCLDNGQYENYFNLEYPTDDAKINELLEYLKNSDPFYQTENFPRIVERVNYFKVQKEGITIMCEIADRIRQEGLIEGKIEDILELLEELGNIPKQLIQRINQETNSDILNKWLKCAAKASSFAEFEAKM